MPLIRPSMDPVTEYTSTTPAAPGAGMTPFIRNRAGIETLALMKTYGIAQEIAPSYGTRNCMAWLAQPGGTGTTSFGMTTPTVQGTLTARALTNTNFSTWWKKAACVSAAGAGSLAELRGPSLVCGVSSTAGMGGFFFVCRFQNDTIAGTTDRMFVGLAPNAAATNVDPSGLLNCMGVGHDAADTNFQMMVNDGASTCTKTDLPTNFVKATTTNVYELRMFCATGSITVTWSMERLDIAGTLLEGTFDVANRPATNTFFVPKIYKANNATAAATAFAYQSVYIETDQ